MIRGERECRGIRTEGLKKPDVANCDAIGEALGTNNLCFFMKKDVEQIIIKIEKSNGKI